MSACRWCNRDHGDVSMWHRVCVICGVAYTQERGVKRPRETCGDPLCVAVQRYRWHYGRLPPHVWFARYAASAGLIRLPRKIEKIAARCAA